MTIQKIYAKINEKRTEGKQAILNGNQELADSVRAEIDELEVQLRAEIEFTRDEQARASANEADTLINHHELGGNDMIKDVNTFETQAYLDAVIDDLMGVANTDAVAVIREANAHTTQSTPTVMPIQLVGAIWAAVEERYPLFAAVPRTSIPTKITYDRNIGHSEINPWVGSESTKTPGVEFKFDKFDLGGHEISLFVPISFKLEVMSRADFQTHLVSQLALVFGKALSQAIYSGTGTGQPTGIKTYLETSAPERIVEFVSASYTTVTGVLALLKSGYKSGLVIYANNETIWNELANITFEDGRPAFVPQVTQRGIATLFGHSVQEAAEMPNGEIMFVSMAHAYRLNVLEGIQVANERDNTGRVTKNFLYAVIDGNVYDKNAVVILRKKTEVVSAKAKKEEIKEK